MQLESQTVRDIVVHVLYKDEELPADGTPPEDAVLVEGIMKNYGFHPERLEEKKADIIALLEELPDDFHARGGGGMSFLNACVDKHGNHWAEHPTMESLFVLGMGIGAVVCPLPRMMWSALPGCVPYYCVDTSKVTNAV